MKTTRISAGQYTLGNGCRFVNVSKVRLDDGWWWIAAADWDASIYSDPVQTKKEAMIIAHEILERGTG